MTLGLDSDNVSTFIPLNTGLYEPRTDMGELDSVRMHLGARAVLVRLRPSDCVVSLGFRGRRVWEWDHMKDRLIEVNFLEVGVEMLTLDIGKYP